MNWMSLRVDEKRKIKLRRWWYRAQDDFNIALTMLAVFGVGVLVFLCYGLWPRP